MLHPFSAGLMGVRGTSEIESIQVECEIWNTELWWEVCVDLSKVWPEYLGYELQVYIFVIISNGLLTSHPEVQQLSFPGQGLATWTKFRHLLEDPLVATVARSLHVPEELAICRGPHSVWSPTWSKRSSTKLATLKNTEQVGY